MRFLLAASLISLLVFRFFLLLGLLEQRLKSESEQRVQALQSRIRPHFLFNCLNTIAELTTEKPAQAEKAIESLSKLFRASLDKVENNHSLYSEIHLCECYLELETWRLGDSMRVSWTNEVKNMKCWGVPKLILQPLIENAVIHGRDDLGKVNITIDIKETKKDLSMMITNRIGSSNHLISEDDDNLRNGMAVDNIRERLFVLYDDNHAFKVRSNLNEYRVIMRIPKEVL